MTGIFVKPAPSNGQAPQAPAQGASERFSIRPLFDEISPQSKRHDQLQGHMAAIRAEQAKKEADPAYGKSPEYARKMAVSYEGVADIAFEHQVFNISSACYSIAATCYGAGQFQYEFMRCDTKAKDAGKRSPFQGQEPGLEI